VNGALGDDDPVARSVRDQLELPAAVDGERRQVARVDPDRVAAERGGTLELLLVVGLDERVEADRLGVRHQGSRTPVVEIAQDEERRVGTCGLQVVELGLFGEESLAEER